MAKILQCPRCQQSMDVTSVSGGTTVRCPDCGQMARVPTGNTSVRAKTVSTPIPAPQPVPSPGARGTRVRERRSSGTMVAQKSEQKSNNGLFIGLGIGAVAVIAVVVFFTMGDAPSEPPPRATVPKESGPVVFTPKLPPSSEKPLVLGAGGTGKDDSKPTPIARGVENVENANWDQLMKDLRPGGGFDHLDRPEGIAFAKVKSFGKAAYPKLIKYIDDEEPAIAVAAVAVLNALTGRDSPYPKGVTKAKIKAEWEEWLKTAGDAKPDAPKQ